jgi:hypothetical protein
VFALAGLYIDGVSTDPKNNLTFNISNKDKHVSSDVSCQQNLCYLTDSTTDFSNWLNTFNVTNNPIEHWPIFIYNTAQGQRLLMVNKVGFKEIDGQNNHFDFDTGRHQTYSIKINEKISDIK